LLSLVGDGGLVMAAPDASFGSDIDAARNPVRRSWRDLLENVDNRSTVSVNDRCGVDFSVAVEVTDYAHESRSKK
jgi:hypothetical protein